MATNTTPALTRFDVLVEACAATALHLAQVRDTSAELVARRDLEAMAAMLLQRRQGILMSATEGDRITVSSTWLFEALGQSRSDGFSDGRSIVQPLCDWANNHPLTWRDALAEHVADPALREILETILERT